MYHILFYDFDFFCRFKIPVRVTDATGMLILSMFEQHATKLFRKSAATMFQTYLNVSFK